MIRIALALVSILLAARPNHADALPNILVILVDDLGVKALSCYGGEYLKTPHIDALAATGTKFESFYATPQCSPTRGALLSGLHPATTRFWHVIPAYGYPFAPVSEPAYRQTFPAELCHLPQALKEKDYATGLFGKWHLSVQQNNGYKGLDAATASSFGFTHCGPKLGREHFQEGADRGVEQLTEDALLFIRDQAESPWFCYLSHYMIHGKVVAPDELTPKYEALGFSNSTSPSAVYLAGIETIDRSVGKIVSTLQELGVYERTCIIFLSDNGAVWERRSLFPEEPPSETDTQQYRFPILERSFPNAPQRGGKGSLYEGGVRVPCIVKWPQDFEPSRESGEPRHVIDIAPTCYALARIDVDKRPTSDGFNLRVPLPAPRPLHQYAPLYDIRWSATPAASILSGDYKLVMHFGDFIDSGGSYHHGQKLELFHLSDDPSESVDLAEALPEIAEQMRLELVSWIQEKGLEIPVRNAKFQSERAFEEAKFN